jgi:uncharacterized protein YggE
MPDAAESTEADLVHPNSRRGRPAGPLVLIVAVVAAVLLGGAALGVTVSRQPAAAAPVRAPASCGPTTPKLTVEGVGEATATPDLLTVVVQVDAAGPSATAALASDNTKATAAVAALRYGGVEPKDIETSGLSLHPQYAYPKGVPTVTGYQVTNSVTATLRSISKSGAVIDGVVGVAGNAVQIESVGFSSDHPGMLEDRARARAATQAVAHAKALARAAGRSLGRVCSLTDQSPPAAGGATNGALAYSSAGSDAAAVPIEAGSQSESAQVSLVYALQPLVTPRPRHS